MAIFRHSTVVSHAFTGDSDIAGSAFHPTRQCKRTANSASPAFSYHAAQCEQRL